MRILIIANNMLARLGLAAMLTEWEQAQVIGQTALTDSLADEITRWQPDAALIEYSATADRRYYEALQGLPTVALLADPTQAAGGVAALAGCGAYGLLLNDTDTDAISSALQAVHTGLIALDPLLAPDLMSAPFDPDADASAALTPREREVLQLMAEGLPNKTIGARLNISANTVKFHINAILSKLDAQSRTEAVVRATRLGLIIL